VLAAGVGWVGHAGQAMLLVGALVMVACALIGAARSLVVLRRAAALRRSLEQHRARLALLSSELEALRAENRHLLRPLRRVHRWARHPLVGALWTSYRLRRRRRRD
jgi:type VI protein secretion system component VasK